MFFIRLRCVVRPYVGVRALYAIRLPLSLLTVCFGVVTLDRQERDAFLNDRRKKEREKAMGELASFFIGPTRAEKERVVEAGKTFYDGDA